MLQIDEKLTAISIIAGYQRDNIPVTPAMKRWMLSNYDAVEVVNGELCLIFKLPEVPACCNS